MSNICADLFSYTAGLLLSTANASWVKHSGSGGNMKTCPVGTGSGVRADDANTEIYYHNTTPPSADYTVAADATYPSGGNSGGFVGVLGRVVSGATTFYRSRYNSSGGAVQLTKTVGGTLTQLGSNSTQTFATNETHNLKLKMQGSTIEAYWDGGTTPVVSVTDTAITAAGFAGITIAAFGGASDTLGYQLDNFTADTIAGGGGGSHSIGISNSQQSNQVSAFVIKQEHKIGIVNSQISDQTSSAAVTQTHKISFSSSNQSNQASSMMVSADGTVRVMGSNSQISNQASSLVIKQTHKIGIASATQGNQTTAAAISSTGGGGGTGYTLAEIAAAVWAQNLNGIPAENRLRTIQTLLSGQ